MTNWPLIHLLEGRLRWWRGKATYRRRELAKHHIIGDRAHHWYDQHVREGNKAAAAANMQQIEVERAYIRKWAILVNEADAEIHRLQVAINALKPKTQQWHLGGLVAPGVLWTSQRFDQGKDFTIPIFTSVRAPGNGQCTEWAHDRAWPNGFGDPYAVIRLDSGPWHDAAHHLDVAPEFYVGHANEPIVRPGQRFTEGEPLARVDHGFVSGQGWCEFGHWPPGPMTEGARFASACVTVTR